MKRRYIRREDVAQIEAEALERLKRELPERLGPDLTRLAKRCAGDWGPTEQAEWDESRREIHGGVERRAARGDRSRELRARRAQAEDVAGPVTSDAQGRGRGGTRGTLSRTPRGLLAEVSLLHFALSNERA